MSLPALTPKIISGLVVAFLASAGISYAVTPSPSALISPGAALTEEEVGKAGSFRQFANFFNKFYKANNPYFKGGND